MLTKQFNSFLKKKKKLLMVGLHVGGPITNSYKLKFKITVGAYGFIHSNKNPKL